MPKYRPQKMDFFVVFILTAISLVTAIYATGAFLIILAIIIVIILWAIFIEKPRSDNYFDRLYKARLMQELESWIYNTLVGKDEFLNTLIFEKKLAIYFTPLASNFVATIINGSSHRASYKVNPGEFQYNHIIRKVATVTEGTSAVWFYYTVIDNAVGQLNDVWECNYNYCLDYPLEKFETEPAKEGGVSYLGLLSKNKSWLLLHTYEPSESLEITFYGSQTTVNNLKNGLTKSK